MLLTSPVSSKLGMLDNLPYAFGVTSSCLGTMTHEYYLHLRPVAQVEMLRARLSGKGKSEACDY